jgi:hypothetical protein
MKLLLSDFDRETSFVSNSIERTLFDKSRPCSAFQALTQQISRALHLEPAPPVSADRTQEKEVS